MFDHQKLHHVPREETLQVIETSLTDAIKYGNAIYDFFALRKQVFVDALNWQIPHNDMVEMDQYDTIKAKYILTMYKGQVVGGTRLLPVNAENGDYTYMIGDALQRKTSILPATFPSCIGINNKAWEGTRLVISKRLLKSRKLRMECLRLILSGIQKVLHDNQSTSLVTISAVNMAKLLHRYGLFPEQLDRPFICTDDGREYAIFNTEFPSSSEKEMPMLGALQSANPTNVPVGELYG
jgi:acyl homoserine lactone synthase